ncbi:hypothetical protein Poly51_55860 [Rubripirellula tenax]|uniref:Uncharacterized protein n=2 Tax=Rubripirellula tenax TaxID=2528015 RepID=A0A5C6EEN5_9BACT|nr:hypothetical protein Poly51_55860 [Rubripirellula tenax]
MDSQNNAAATSVQSVVRRCVDCGSTNIVKELPIRDRVHEGPQPSLCWPDLCRHQVQVQMMDGSDPPRCAWCGKDYSETRELTLEEQMDSMARNRAAWLD